MNHVSVGIDYSLTSPAIAVSFSPSWEDTTVYLLTKTKAYIDKCYFGRIFFQGHSAWESSTERFDNISGWAMDIISSLRNKKGLQIHISMEDYALGAKGRTFDMAENQGILKWKLWKEGFHFDLVSPGAIKKFATGKGNAKKDQMGIAFSNLTGVNLLNEIPYKGKKALEISPFSDIGDAFLIGQLQWSIIKASMNN